jgi:uncharacterized membrane protein HdeD (DUF308 family)
MPERQLQTAGSPGPAAPGAGAPLAPVGSLLWVLFVHGAVAGAAGILLLVRPDRGLLFAALTLGGYLMLVGLLQVLRAVALRDLVGTQRALIAIVGVLAVAAGAIVIARPEGTVLGVALAFGIYLIVAGLAAGVSAAQNPATRALDGIRAVIDVAAGITIVVWPDVSVGVVATVLGIYLLARGAVEVVAGLKLRSLRASA